MKILKTIGLFATATVLSACSQVSPSNEALLKVIENESFTIPQEYSPSGSWSELAVVCPYASTGGLPVVFDAEEQELLDDGVQWVFFADGETFKTVLDRRVVDFCSGSSSTIFSSPSDEWVSERERGRWVVSKNGGQ